MFPSSRFNIKGKATHPKPQGPYEIKSGSYTTITFKNIFDETRIFKTSVDREEFYVKTLYEPIRSKKVISNITTTLTHNMLIACSTTSSVQFR